MSRPLSIKFASECAFAATSNFVDLIDRAAPTTLTDRNDQAILQYGPTTFNTSTDSLYAETYAFSGNNTWSKKDKMGFITKGTGTRKNEILITFRGSNRLLNDYVLIDAATAAGTSPKGYAVHGGFAKVFQSCVPDIERQLARLRPFHTIHCVGHSMGGALATLCAEHFINSTSTPYLYTFGAPRVGMLPHAQYMQKHLGERLNRYYYAGDVVTWLPPYPFVHMTGKRLISRGNFFASHVGYIDAAGLVLANGQKAQTTADSWAEAERLIDQGQNVAGGCGMESKAWRIFTQALHKILAVVGGIIGLILIPSITIIDQVVSAISFIVTQDEKKRPLIVRWLVGSFYALGKIVSIGKDKFVAMLRYILSLMLSSVQTKTQRELAEARRIEAFNGLKTICMGSAT